MAIAEMTHTEAGRSLVAASLAPVTSRSWRQRALIAVLGLLVLAGAVAFAVQLRDGLGVTGKNDAVFWGLYTTDLVTLIGLSYGGALVSAILRLTNARWRGPVTRLAEGTALVTLLVGASFPLIHLGRPDRVWEMFVRPQFHSPLLWDMVAILTYLIATVVLFWLPLVPDLAETRDRPEIGRWRSRVHRVLSLGWVGGARQRKVLERAMTIVAILIIPVAVMVHTVLSYAFSLTSRPGWNSTIFGPYFVVAAVYSGVAVVLLAVLAYRRAFRLHDFIPDRALHLLGFVMVTMGVAYAYFMFTEITTEGYVGEESAQGVLYALMLDRYAPMFWVFLVAGIVLPILLVILPWTRRPSGLAVAAALVVGALWMKRFLMIVPPLTRPLVGEVAGAYSPTWVEWLVTVGAAAAVPLLLILLFRTVPVLAIHEMEETGTVPVASGGTTR